MTGRKKELYGAVAACLLGVAALVAGCEMATGNMGAGDSIKISEMERRIVDLEKKLTDLTREVAEINERTAVSEKGPDASGPGTARKPIKEEAVGGETGAVTSPDTTTPKETTPPGTKAAEGPDTASAPPADEAGSKDTGTPADTTAAPPGDVDTKNPQALYDRALAEIMNRKAEAALPLFSEFVKDFPNDELTDNAFYWIGECYYLMSDYRRALDQFRGVTERFPDRDKTPDALLKMGYCYEKLGDAAHAKEVYNKVIASFPDSSAAELARDKMK
jgi:tol-pal system protein YbgF